MACGMAGIDPSQTIQGIPDPKGTCNGLGEMVKMKSREDLNIFPNSVTSFIKDLND